MVTLLKDEWFMRLVKDWTLSIRDGNTVTYTENILDSALVKEMYLDKYEL